MFRESGGIQGDRELSKECDQVCKEGGDCSREKKKLWTLSEQGSVC